MGVANTLIECRFKTSIFLSLNSSEWFLLSHFAISNPTLQQVPDNDLYVRKSRNGNANRIKCNLVFIRNKLNKRQWIDFEIYRKTIYKNNLYDTFSMPYIYPIFHVGLKEQSKRESRKIKSTHFTHAVMEKQSAELADIIGKPKS